MFKNVLILAAAIVVGFFAVPVFAKDEAPAGPPPAMPISVATTMQREVTKWNEFSGRLRAVEDVQVRPQVGGPITEMHFHEGDLVKKGDLLFTIDQRPFKASYDQANALLAAAKSRVSLTAADLKRARTLFDQKAFSQREFDERNNSQREAAAALAGAQAQVEIAKLNLEYSEIRSPITGRVGRPELTVGNLVEAGGNAPVLTTVQSVDPVYADFDIDEQTYLKAKKAVIEGKVSAMPVYMSLADETDFKREGQIRSFDNQLSGASGTLRVRAEFPNKDGLLTPGLFARIRLGDADKVTAVLINDSAVGTDQDRKFVYTVDDKGNVNYRPVTLGEVDNGLRIIEKGLAPGENIIVNGLMRVHPGMQVVPQMVDMQTLKPAGAPADAAPASGAPADGAEPAPDAAKPDAAGPGTPPADDKAAAPVEAPKAEEPKMDDKPADAAPATPDAAPATDDKAAPADKE